MLSRRRPSRYRERRPGAITDAEIIAGELDTPYYLEEEWDIYRLGKKAEHLWMAQLGTPLPVTAAAVAHEYSFPFNFTITRASFYQRDAAGAENTDAVNLRFDILHPNRTPSIIYFDNASWVGGELSMTGARYSPAAALVFTLSGTNTNVVHVNVEFEVHGVA